MNKYELTESQELEMLGAYSIEDERLEYTATTKLIITDEYDETAENRHETHEVEKLINYYGLN